MTKLGSSYQNKENEAKCSCQRERWENTTNAKTKVRKERVENHYRKARRLYFYPFIIDVR